MTDSYRPISDYGVIGNLETVALVSSRGSVDWCCLPHLDSASVFAALLDTRAGGRFSIMAADDFDSVQDYTDGTNILSTRMRTPDGLGRLLDFMPVFSDRSDRPGDPDDPDDPGPDESDYGLIYRILRQEEGRGRYRLEFSPGPDYGRGRAVIEPIDGGVRTRGSGPGLELLATTGLDVHGSSATAEFVLSRGEEARFSLALPGRGPGPGPECVCEEMAGQALERTTAFWRSWLERDETGRSVDFGPYADMCRRCGLVLKLLAHKPSGALAAAATTSLPEWIGGERNWDYRFTWIRDTSQTLQALYNLGHLSEIEDYLRWLESILSGDPSRLRIMYGLRGETDLAEETLDHLEGYKGSAPVRAGNGAAAQRQLDIFGEIMNAALKLSDYVGRVDQGLWRFLARICDHVCDVWREPDDGIWEVRNGPFHFVYSKVMCWVALDRGLTIADRYGFPADRGRWEAERDAVKAEVLLKGFKPARGRGGPAFTQHYDTDQLDASVLTLPVLGFLPAQDPRMRSTIRAVQRELAHGDGFVYRYLADDGVQGQEGCFLLCSFWLADCLLLLGRTEEARDIMNRITRAKNRQGLFSEEYDPAWDEYLGNYPQAFTHIGYVNTAARLMAALNRNKTPEPEPRPWHARFTAPDVVLNQGDHGPSEASPDVSPQEAVPRLMTQLSLMRGAFFSTTRGRVAYERMRGSALYESYTATSAALAGFDPRSLETREQKLAFWVNLYNILVIHGVVAMGARDSLKEIPGFFKRVRYRVGEHLYCPDDIEHGILRGNRRPPSRLLRPFRGTDPRKDLAVDPPDPRIHFAMVCGSRSCPPIDVYTAENIEQELDLAGRAFINTEGVRLEPKQGAVVLSRIFDWYAEDFGPGPTQRLEWIAGFLHRDQDRDWLRHNAADLAIRYKEYDWRLNRAPEAA
jgi:GH15 family glucan-1,4-alpha-glucosidase